MPTASLSGSAEEYTWYRPSTYIVYAFNSEYVAEDELRSKLDNMTLKVACKYNLFLWMIYVLGLIQMLACYGQPSQ
jgi:hypothetical protein